MDFITLAFGILQIIFQWLVVLLSFHIMRMAPSSRFWTFISIAFTIMAVRRVTSIIVVFEQGYSFGLTLNYVDIVILPLLISFFMFLTVYGLWFRVRKKQVEIKKVKEHLY